jgi:excisionase family DNA binding protein
MGGEVSGTPVARRGKALPPPRNAEPWPEVMTAEEAASYLRITKDKLYELIKQGVVPAARLGREWRILFADLRGLFSTAHDDLEFDE